MLPLALEQLIEQLEKLPGVGRRTAERYAYDLLRSSPVAIKEIAAAINDLHDKVKYCPVTFALIDSQLSVSPLYEDPGRDKQIVAVVAQPYDVIALERTHQFKGTYHVLGGLLSPIDGVSPSDLHLDSLDERIKRDSVKELVLATSGSVEGESTASYIQKLLGEFKDLKITVLARGLPAGLDVEYADQITLTQALIGRRPL